MRKVGEVVTIMPKKWYDVSKNKLTGEVYNPSKYHSGLTFTKKMSEFCGKKLTIEQAFHNDKLECVYKMVGNGHLWAEYMFDGPTKRRIRNAKRKT